MSKFKPGDKVKIIVRNVLNRNKGDIVTLKELFKHVSFYEEWTFYEGNGLVFSDEFELYEEKPLALDIPMFKNSLNLKVKKLHQDAVIPKYAKPGDAALDLTATTMELVGDQLIYGIGLAFEIPEGYVGLIFPRSSVCKTSQTLSNSVGVIDSGYRGEVKFVFNCSEASRPTYRPGDRIGQLIIMPYPEVVIEEVEELSDTERGTGAFGSSGA